MKVSKNLIMAIAAAAAFLAPVAVSAQTDASRVDAVFARWNSDSTPGCAAAVSRGGQIILERAYGMSDLEDRVRNTPNTIFEAGSVSKQFTAAAIVLLALEGKLSLDDPVRKYVPELPDNASAITIRHMMNHTSGLRDWGSVAGIGGWPRTTRVHTHAHVLDILSRQRALNFEPGAQYSYSNSGYNLMAVIVDRVSGMSFAEFSLQRLFRPLGMNNTQWRDDYTRIVPGRSVAYSARGASGWATNMPFENVHGNGGLLTTVGDLLIWTENLETGRLGGAEFVRLMHQRGVLNSGDTITYAGGLMVGRYAGTSEVSHTGSTAGYRAFLARYPDQRVGVAVLCNVASVNPGGVGHGVADVFLTPVVAQGRAGGRGAGAGAAADSAAGGRGGGRGAGAGAAAPAPYVPSEPEITSLAGEYYSPDADAIFTVVVENGRAIMLRRPATRIALTPVARDQFSASGFQSVRIIRDASGRAVQISVRQDRVFDLRFDRIERQ